MEYKILNTIKSPTDLKALDEEKIAPLCDEIRECLIDTVSHGGGHLASNLGTVELTVALHRVFNSPEDSIIFDVGHQSYTHKLLTGRFDNFSSIRKEGGISGFMRPNESIHDPFTTGHSSNAISAAYGIYKAKKLNNENGTCIAVVGDGAMTGGMVYEALNNVGTAKGNFIVVLNDNKMSISKNVGSLARHLTVMRLKPRYHRFKGGVEKFLLHVPFIGNGLYRVVSKLKNMLKNAVYYSNIFIGLGLNYLGPVDGHNEKALESIFDVAKNSAKPVLVHVLTKKGKGYKFAEEKPNVYHGVSPFDVEEGAHDDENDNFSLEFGKALSQIAEKDDKICAITAAMTSGTGLIQFSEKFKSRFFDVGIAEQHAVTFAAGLASRGLKPVLAVYSSFLQRGYDQIIHDAAISAVPITICVDRAGFVGEDGETHQGLFDVAFLSHIPNVEIFSPTSFSELHDALLCAVNSNKISVVRYPRGKEYENVKELNTFSDDYSVFGKGETALISYGREFSNLLYAKEKLENISLIKLNKISPIPQNLISELLKFKKIYFFEEGIKNGGIGERIGNLLLENGYKGMYKNTAVDDRFMPPATVARQFEMCGLDADSIINTVKGE